MHPRHRGDHLVLVVPGTTRGALHLEGLTAVHVLRRRKVPRGTSDGAAADGCSSGPAVALHRRSHGSAALHREVHRSRARRRYDSLVHHLLVGKDRHFPHRHLNVLLLLMLRHEDLGGGAKVRDRDLLERG
jgi:hypothetical protein